MKAFIMESGMAYLKNANRTPGAGVPTGAEDKETAGTQEASNDAA
jgi:hypothetical protein